MQDQKSKTWFFYCHQSRRSRQSCTKSNSLFWWLETRNAPYSIYFRHSIAWLYARATCANWCYLTGIFQQKTQLTINKSSHWAAILRACQKNILLYLIVLGDGVEFTTRYILLVEQCCLFPYNFATEPPNNWCWW